MLQLLKTTDVQKRTGWSLLKIRTLIQDDCVDIVNHHPYGITGDDLRSQLSSLMIAKNEDHVPIERELSMWKSKRSYVDANVNEADFWQRLFDEQGFQEKSQSA